MKHLSVMCLVAALLTVCLAVRPEPGPSAAGTAPDVPEDAAAPPCREASHDAPAPAQDSGARRNLENRQSLPRRPAPARAQAAPSTAPKASPTPPKQVPRALLMVGPDGVVYRRTEETSSADRKNP